MGFQVTISACLFKREGIWETQERKLEESSFSENLCCHTHGCSLSPGHMWPTRGLSSPGSCHKKGSKFFLAHSQRVCKLIRIALHRLKESHKEEGPWRFSSTSSSYNQATGDKWPAQGHIKRQLQNWDYTLGLLTLHPVLFLYHRHMVTVPLGFQQRQC